MPKDASEISAAGAITLSDDFLLTRGVDTLRGDFIEMAKALGLWRVVHKVTVPVGHTAGATTETLISGFTLPGGSLGPNGLLRITTQWRGTGTGNKTMRIRFGGTTLAGDIYLAVVMTTQLSNMTQHIIRNQNNQAIQEGMPLGTPVGGFGTTTAVTDGAGTRNTAVDQLVEFSAQVAGAGENLSIKTAIVECVYGA